MARTFPTCGFEAFPNGDIRLWVGDNDGANSEPLTDDQLESLIRNLQAVMRIRGQLDVTWIVPRPRGRRQTSRDRTLISHDITTRRETP